MNKKLSSARWLRRFLALTLAVLAVLAVLVYVIDPYSHYRAYDHKYKLDKIFSVPGVVRNFDYDTIIIGSSMTQNFDMDSFRRELGQNPIKATLGGMDWPEMAALLKLACSAVMRKSSASLNTCWTAIPLTTTATSGAMRSGCVLSPWIWP